MDKKNLQPMLEPKPSIFRKATKVVVKVNREAFERLKNR